MIIYISGCAHSGTTLLLRLFSAFEGVEVIPGEHDIEVVLGIEQILGRTTVIKRSWNDDFAGRRITQWWHTDKGKALRDEIRPLVIVRDGKDVIIGGHVSPLKWVVSIEHLLMFNDQVDITIRYEDLVSNPDEIQDLVADHYGLSIKHRWSKYPNFVPKGLLIQRHSQQNYLPRPIDTNKIGKNSTIYKQLCDEELLNRFECCLRRCGYAE